MINTGSKDEVDVAALRRTVSKALWKKNVFVVVLKPEYDLWFYQADGVITPMLFEQAHRVDLRNHFAVLLRRL